MSRNSSAKLSAQDRLALARRIKDLRLQRGVRQEDLAEWASVSRQTLSDIENGNVAAPQMKTLIRIYDALGVDIHPPEFEEQTQLWLAMLGTLIEAVPEERRSGAVDKAVVAISGEIAPRANITALPSRNVGGSTDTDLETVELDITKIAASKDNTPVHPSRGEA
jgi:transcriptional regulator with XRE-family HTH domain